MFEPLKPVYVFSNIVFDVFPPPFTFVECLNDLRCIKDLLKKNDKKGVVG